MGEKISGNDQRISITERLRDEKERTGFSFLKMLATNLIENKKQPLVYNQSVALSEGYYQLLQLLIDTEEAIASGKDHVEIRAERTGKKPKLSEDESRAEHARTQSLTNLLIEDPSGFSLIDVAICEATARNIMSDLEKNASIKENPFLQGRWMASQDYKKFYLLGAEAGLCPPPKKAGPVFEFGKYPIKS